MVKRRKKTQDIIVDMYSIARFKRIFSQFFFLNL